MRNHSPSPFCGKLWRTKVMKISTRQTTNSGPTRLCSVFEIVASHENSV